MHSIGSNCFHINIIIHESLLYPVIVDQSIIISGTLLYLFLSTISFLGYTLINGQLSYWGGTVILTLLNYYGIMILFLGNHIYSTSSNCRFFVIHSLLPFILVIFSCIHIFYLHGLMSSRNVLYVSNSVASITIFPYIIIKDIIVILDVIHIFSILIFSIFNIVHPDIIIEINELITPLHIVPEWYFLHLYLILKLCPSKHTGSIIFIISFYIIMLCPINIIETSIMNSNILFSTMLISSTTMFLSMFFIGCHLPITIYTSYSRIITL